MSVEISPFVPAADSMGEHDPALAAQFYETLGDDMATQTAPAEPESIEPFSRPMTVMIEREANDDDYAMGGGTTSRSEGTTKPGGATDTLDVDND
jgi:hypothetical protein